MFETILYEKKDHIATLTLNQPEKRNPLGGKSIDEFVSAMEEFHRDDDAKVLVLTGAGKSFCAGGDVKSMAQRDGSGKSSGADGESGSHSDPFVQREHYRRGIQRIPRAFATLDKPVIAAINGAAVGAGCDLCLMSDIRIAGEHAKFGEIFCKVGLAPGDGGGYFLPRIVGIEKACELTFTGDIINAEEALRIGMVSRVVPNDELLPTTYELAGRIASGPTLALKMAKAAIYGGLNQTLDQHLDMMALMQAMLHGTEDHREGVRAFAEKRPPQFKGR